MKRLTVSLAILSLAVAGNRLARSSSRPVKDAVEKVVADALTTTLPPAATTAAASCFGEASQLIIR